LGYFQNTVPSLSISIGGPPPLDPRNFLAIILPPFQVALSRTCGRVNWYSHLFISRSWMRSLGKKSISEHSFHSRGRTYNSMTVMALHSIIAGCDGGMRGIPESDTVLILSFLRVNTPKSTSRPPTHTTGSTAFPNAEATMITHHYDTLVGLSSGSSRPAPSCQTPNRAASQLARLASRPATG